MKQTIFKVEGLSCQGCANAVTNVLNDVDGVQSAVIDLDNASAQVDFDETLTTFETLRAAVDEAGYTLVKLSRKEDSYD